MSWVKVCDISNVKEDEIFRVDIDDKKVMIIKKSDNIYALDRICTHEYADLADGFITDDRITCPLHLAQFEIKSGKVLNPPADKPLKLYNIKIEAGSIYIEMER